MLVGKPYISCVLDDKKEVSENSRILLSNSKKPLIMKNEFLNLLVFNRIKFCPNEFGNSITVVVLLLHSKTEFSK